ncbi:MAG: hypothetical protein EBT36_04840 [Betaproteobacteria bacterium]|nr:hypothetical protein [Betaproteobacteria bacterium]
MTPAEKTDVVLLVPVHQDTDDQLRARYKVHEYFRVKDQGPALQAAFFKNLAHCEIVVTTGSSGIQAPLMQQLPSLRLVACFGVGVDGVDLAYARSRGIAVTNTPDVLSDEVADFAMALLLASLIGLSVIAPGSKARCRLRVRFKANALGLWAWEESVRRLPSVVRPSAFCWDTTGRVPNRP